MGLNRSGLGRGLAALLPDAAGGPGGATQVPVDQIRPNPFQPRRDFDPLALEELAASIRRHGLVQPVTVRPAPDGHGYQLVAGERRLRAAKLAGLPTVPAVVRPCTERELLEIALIENLQREDINAIEAAVAYRRCLDEFGLTQEELAQQLGKSRAAVANTLRLLKLAPAVQAAIAAGRLSEGHGRALLALVEPDDQCAVAQRIESEGLNVREAERLARERRAGGARRRAKPAAGAAVDAADLTAYAQGLERRLGTRVEIHPRRDGGGTLVIHYFGPEDLDRIAEALKP
jgi:ParB family chromosome partitioning protein